MMNITKSILICMLFIKAAIINCSATNIIISSNGKHEALDCATSSIPMQVENPNPNYFYHWHYVFFNDSSPGGGCSYYDTFDFLIGTGDNITVSTNVGDFFAIVCYADSGGMIWDDSHWFKVRKPGLKAPLCKSLTPSVGPCGERYISIPWTLYLDSSTFINLQWFKNGLPVTPGGINPPFDITLDETGYYALRAQVGNCGYAWSDSVHVQINRPTPIISAAGATSFCSGNSVLLSAITGGGASFQWKKNGVVISGATSSSYMASATGNYKVVKTNASGCTGTSPVAAVVTVYGLPTAAVTPQGPTTFCTGDSVKLKTPANANYTYIWKRNNVNINSASLSKYYAKTQGSYKVKVTNTNGCTKISNTVSVTVPCKEEGLGTTNSPTKISVFPNPTSDQFSLKTISLYDNHLHIKLFDLSGRMVLEREMENYNENFQFGSNLVPGIYFLKINESVQPIKLCKTR